MDWLTFISELVKAIAWPLAGVVIVIVLRRPISGLLSLLRKLKYKDLELEFAHEVRELKEAAAAVLPEQEDVAPAEPELVQRVAELSRISTTAAIAEAWQAVEVASREMFKRRGLGVAMDHQTRRVLLRKELPTDLFKLTMQLRNLRMKALHVEDHVVSQDDAVDFGKIAAKLVDYMRDSPNGE